MASFDLGRLVLGACVFAAACGGSGADGDGSGGGSSNPTASDSSASDDALPTGPGSLSQGSASGTMGSADSTATMGTATMGTDDDPTMSTGTEPDLPDEPGCGGIDFLFVIDDSGSMAAHQATLLASFPGFIDAIQTSLEGITDNYHVGVITSDAYEFNEAGCQSLGDLVTQTGGDNSLGQVCTPFVEGNRFATEQDDLAVAFPCMAQVGTEGSFIELPVSGAIAALDAAHNGAGACNDGFLRDDSVLVVVVVTDDPPFIVDMDDAHPNADTTGWHQAVLDAKNGNAEAVVVIGFVPWDDTSCTFMNLESPNLIDFVMSFGDQGVLASICEPDFGPAFASAVQTIVTSCEAME